MEVGWSWGGQFDPYIDESAAARGGAATLTGGTFKLPDATINALRTKTDESMTYRLSSPQVAAHYFFPGSCVYKHITDSDSACARVSVEHSTSASPTYMQCGNWGGGKGGLDAWYQCNGSGYTNMAKSHSEAPYGVACITQNPSGGSHGDANGTTHSGGNETCGFQTPVLMWVR